MTRRLEPESINSVMQKAIMQAIVSQFQCDCETCSHTAAICPATASAYVQEIATLRRDIGILAEAMFLIIYKAETDGFDMSDERAAMKRASGSIPIQWRIYHE